MRAGYRRSVRRAMSGRRSRRVGRGRSAKEHQDLVEECQED